MKAITTPGELMDALNAFRLSRVILSAYELDLFNQLTSGPMTSAEISARIATDPRATERILNALVGTGLIRKEKSRFANTPFSEKFLVSSSPSYVGGIGHMSGLWKTWSTLTEAVRAGASVAMAELNEINSRGEEWLDAFIAAMHFRAVPQGKEFADMLDLSATKKVLDVGGGSGAFTFSMIRKNPAIHGVVFDLPNVVPITRRYIEKAGLKDKVTTAEGDYLEDDLGSGFDLVLMSAIIHINSPSENLRLIAKGATALATGGQLVIRDQVMNEDRTEPWAGALFALNMLVGTPHGDTYTEEEISGWMKQAGLKDITLLTSDSGMQLMTGRKP